MFYCYKCGVEIDESLDQCPLCNTPIPLQAKKTKQEQFPIETVIEMKKIEESLEQPAKKKEILMTTVLVTVIFLIPALILLSIAHVKNASLGWAQPPLFTLTVSWASIVSFMFLHRKKKLLAAIYMILLPGLLFLLDFSDGRLDWFIRLGVPILAALYLHIFAIYLLVKKFIHKRLYIIASILFALGIFVVLLEGIINYALFGTIHVSWSLICSSIFFPSGGFMIILAYLVRSTSPNRKKFKI